MNANIARQFEFIQNAWLMSAGFEGLTGERDPVLGTRSGDGTYASLRHVHDSDCRVAPAGVCTTCPSSLRVQGGAYFFLPGIRALRYLATIGGHHEPDQRTDAMPERLTIMAIRMFTFLKICIVLVLVIALGGVALFVWLGSARQRRAACGTRRRSVGLTAEAFRAADEDYFRDMDRVASPEGPRAGRADTGGSERPKHLECLGGRQRSHVG